jgi:prevent-host-death family protein
METKKNEADVRDVQAHLDAYLRRLQEGEAITITDQGVPVGRLLPPESSASTGKRLNELQEAGLVEWSGEPFSPTPSTVAAEGDRSLSELLLENRR